VNDQTEFILSIVLRARDEMAGAFAEATAQVSAFRTAVRGLNSDLEPLNNNVTSLTRRLGSLRDRIRETNTVFGENNRNIHDTANEFQRLEGSVRSIGSEFNGMRSNIRSATADVVEHRRAVRETQTEHRSWVDALESVGVGMQSAGLRVKSLGSEMRGLVILGVVGFFQQLATSAIALGGNLVGLAGSASFAGAALGGALTAGVAQAIPAVGLLAASVQRLGDVFQALKYRQQARQQEFTQQMQRDSREARSANQVESALDGVVSANERLADAQRRVARAEENVPVAQDQIRVAQERLNEARHQAVRQLDDLISKEREAELTARGASLSVEEAQRNLREALGSGDSLRIDQARLQLDASRNAASESRRNLQQVRKDNAEAAARGVEGDTGVRDASRGVDAAKRSARDAREAVEDARRGVADAQRGIAQAQRAVENARKTNDVATNNAVVAQRNLEYFLQHQLSGSERRLYEVLTKISDDYYSIVRHATDKIIDSFTFVAGRVEKLLRNPRIKEAMDAMGESLGANIGRIGEFLTSDRIVAQFLRISEASRENLGPITSILENVLRMFGDVAEAAGPALRDILEWITGISDKWAEFIENGRKNGELGAFFERGVTHLKAWVDLIGAVINLFAALFGSGGGADSGLRIIQRITDGINGWAESVRENADKVKKFFKDSEDVLGDLWRLIKSVGEALFGMFDPEAVTALVNIIVQVAIPAIVQIIDIIATFVKAAEAFLTFWKVGDIVVWVAVMLGVTRALTTMVGLLGTGVRTFAQFAGGIRTTVTLMGAMKAAVLALGGGWSSATAAFRGYMAEAEASKLARAGTVVAGGAAAGTAAEAAVETQLVSGLPSGVGREAKRGAQLGALTPDASNFVTLPDGRRVHKNSPAARNARTTREQIFNRAPVVTLSDGRRAPRNSPAERAERDRIIGSDQDAANAENDERDRVTAEEDATRRAERRTTRRATARRVGGRVAKVGAVAALAVGANLLPDAAQDRNLADVGSTGDIVGGQVVNQIQSLVSLDIKGWIAQWSGDAGTLNRFAKTAEDSLTRMTNTRNVNGIKDLAKQARDMAKAFPDSADALTAFADKAEAAAGNVEHLKKMTKLLGDSLQDFKALKFDERDIIDPAAIRNFLSNLDRMRGEGFRSIKDFRDYTSYSLEQINKGFSEGSASWAEAIATNAGQGIASLRASMKSGQISVADGMKEINRVTKQQMKFARDNMDNLSDDARRTLSANFDAALDATIDKVGGIEKATGDSLRKIRKLMAAQFELFGLTPEEAAQLARNRTSHDPNRRNLDQNNRPEEGHSFFKAGGGWIGLPGERGADTTSIRVGRGEAVLHAAHQAYVEPALQAVYGHGLDRMFQRVRGWHGGPDFGSLGFAAGGRTASLFDGHPANVNSGVRSIVEQMKRLFPLTVYSTTDHSVMTTSGNVSDHTTGAAVDLAGAPEVMLRAAEYVKSSGMYRRLKQGIHNPNLAVNLGKLQSPPGQFAGHVWAEHANHIHLAIVGALGKLMNGDGGLTLPNQNVRGAAAAGQLGLLAQTGVDVVTQAANRMLARIAESTGSADVSDVGLAAGFDGPWVAVMRKIASENHWNLGDWRSLVSGESGGHPTARNPSSGAFGLGQFLGATAQAYAKYGALSSDGSEQIRAMAKYIADRYGDPTNAYHTWLGRSPHWYEHGGVLDWAKGIPGLFMGHGGEWVVNPGQQNKLAQMIGRPVGAVKQALGFTGGPTEFAGGGEVLHIGDSLGVGMAETLSKLIKNVVQDNVVGRNSDQALAVLKEKLKKAYREIIFDVGTNDAQASTLSKNIRKAYKMLGDDQTLVLATVRGPNAGEKNKIIRQFAASHDDVQVVDAAALKRGSAGDGIHYGPAGYAARARLFAQASERAPKELTRNQELARGNFEFPDIIPISPEGLLNEAKRLNKALRNVDKKTKESFSSYVNRFNRELDNLTGENGILTLLPAAIQRRSQIRASRLVDDTVGRRRVTGLGSVLVRNLSDSDVTRRQIRNSELEAGEMRDAQEQFRKSAREATGQIDGIDDQIKRLKKGGTTKGEQKQIDDLMKKRATLTSQVRVINEGIRNLDQSIAQNVADRYALQLKQFQDDAAKQIANFQRDQGRQAFRQRMNDAMGIDSGPQQAAIEASQRSQIAFLQQKAAQAAQMGEGDLSQQFLDQAEAISQQIEETTLTIFQNSVSAINERAQRRMSRLDVADRAIAVGLGGQDSALGLTARAQVFAARGNSLDTQRAELADRLRVARETGNQKAIEELTDSINELDVQIRENTIAARQARIDAINARAQFGTGAFGSAIGIVQALGARPGQTLNTGVMGTLLRGAGQFLSTQRTGLTNELGDLGFTDVGDLSTPEGISDFLARVMPWLETLPEAQRNQAEDLVNGLLQNTAATNDNTAQLEDLTGANGQSFTSSAWQMFRTALLTGNGQLIPGLHGMVPSFANGGTMPWDGLANLHAGEVIINPSIGQSMGDTHYHIVTPVERLDGVTLARETAWARKTQGRM
jgi:hypothetical protein